MNSRLAAVRVIHAVCEQGESLDTALAEFSRGLDDRDAAQCQALSYGGVRWYLAYRQLLRSQLKKSFKPKDRILYALLASALYQLDDSRHPPHAVVNESVALTGPLRRQWASGLVNAILRSHQRNQDPTPLLQNPERVRQAYPEWMRDQFANAWPEHVDAILLAQLQPPPMTLRVNTRLCSREAYLERLAQQDIEALPCEDSPVGVTLVRPLAVAALPGFENGMVSVQDESAQLATRLLDPQAGQYVLDACAAPGGKSLHLLEHAPELAGLTLLDLPERLPRLRDNLQRAGLEAEIVAADLLAEPTWAEGRSFDRILLDVPCTGTGVIRRHPDIKFRRQPENGLKFADNQLELLRHAWRLLKPGGQLLYTTCSILPEENEGVVGRFCRQTDSARVSRLDSTTGIQTLHGMQRLPGVQPGDGFFYSLLTRREG